MSGGKDRYFIEVRKDGCRSADTAIGGAGSRWVSSCLKCPFESCRHKSGIFNEVRRDGCGRADRVIGRISFCERCPFDKCVIGKVDIDNPRFDELIKGVTVRPKLVENDLVLIQQALSEYGKKYGKAEYERGNSLVNRILSKQGFHTRKAKYGDKKSG